jgi:hypothetical protein
MEELHVEPGWVRPAYLRLMCLVGIVVLAWGTVGFAMGIVHVADPGLQRQSDPVFRIASAVVDVAQAAYANQDNRDPAVTEALAKSKSELDHQARQAGLNELVHGLIFAIVGLAIVAFHWKRAERPNVLAMPAAQYSPAGPPPTGGGPGPGWQYPPAGPGPPGSRPPGS